MNNGNTSYHANRYNAQSVCEHCHGIFEHERWCLTKDPNVFYAFKIATDPSKITLGDMLILHSLGVAWPESVHDLSLASSVKQR